MCLYEVRAIKSGEGRAKLRQVKAESQMHWTCNGFAPVADLSTPPWPRMRAD
jgi:hypothetical protein